MIYNCKAKVFIFTVVVRCSHAFHGHEYHDNVELSFIFIFCNHQQASGRILVGGFYHSSNQNLWN